MALITTQDFQIPLFHKVYDGNIPDVAFFSEVTQDLLKRHHRLCGHRHAATLVFDKVNLSEETMEKLLYGNIHFIAGAKSSPFKESFERPLKDLEESLLPGTKNYAFTLELFGKECKCALVYSESFFTKQLASLTANTVKCQDKLKILQNSLLAPLKREKGKVLTMKELSEKFAFILSAQQMKEIFDVELTIESGFSMIKYKLNREMLNHLMKHRLGSTLLITNQTSLHPEEVIKGYRD